MMALAIVVVLLVLVCVVALVLGGRPVRVQEADLAEPYREGLHAAVRLQRAAQELEAAMYAEAARHADPTSELFRQD